MSVNLAGPAYRVTVPACVLVATLRLKLKAEQEMVSGYCFLYSHWSSCFGCFFS
ncbi:hypothetical protein HPHPP30_0253 [Helicobacter pylori Hp P-30]|nr:hypothetical protein HPHPP30_0253 [Helicobacter pylori Hp P-30]